MRSSELLSARAQAHSRKLVWMKRSALRLVLGVWGSVLMCLRSSVLQV